MTRGGMEKFQSKQAKNEDDVTVLALSAGEKERRRRGGEKSL